MHPKRGHRASLLPERLTSGSTIVEGFGFFPFIAIICVTGPVLKHLKFKANVELIKSAAEHGQPIDPTVFDKMMSAPARLAKKQVSLATLLRVVGII